MRSLGRYGPPIQAEREVQAWNKEAPTLASFTEARRPWRRKSGWRHSGGRTEAAEAAELRERPSGTGDAFDESGDFLKPVLLLSIQP